MATDASRIRSDDGGLSCRLKITRKITQLDTSRSPELPSTSPHTMVSDSMAVPLETSSPSSRRKSKIAEAIQSMGNLNSNMEPLELPTDPDAQATVTDFLDFTEYLPSDMMRSLTLIGKLDQTYSHGSANVNDLTKTYGKLPDLPADRRPDAVALRAEISDNLAEALNARVLSHAEACRMADNVERHYNRAKNILAKLQAMNEAYPPSREPSPVAEKVKSPIASRVPKITLRLDNSRSEIAVPKRRKHRAPRITVPGEVLAPYELDYESYGSESEESSADDAERYNPRATPARAPGASIIKIKLKTSKTSKSKVPKFPRPPRPPGVMGTNVHSQVAGISTSNALAKLKPPPPEAILGDEHRPWLKLTAWELGSLRKRMKKNAVWSPSDTMIARELKVLGRGLEAYNAAKEEADATGQPLPFPTPPQILGVTVDEEGAISVEALGLSGAQLQNRGMELNQKKKIKKESQAKELAKQAAEEAEESARKMAQAAKAMKGLFDHDEEETPVRKPSSKPKPKTPARTPAAKKRKRESNSDEPEKVDGEAVKAEEEDISRRPAPKRTKTETPVPVPISASLASKESALESIPSETQPDGADASSVPVPETKISSTPILPPGRRLTKKEAAQQREAVKKEKAAAEAAASAPAVATSTAAPTETAASSRPRRSSVAAPATPALEQKRPTSSRSKRESMEPVGTATIDRPRRASTARNTPAPVTESRIVRRTRRPAPGNVTASSDGSTTAVSVGRRSATTRKKAGVKKEKKDGREESDAQELFDEIVDDEGNVIDPDEEKYCSCNRVSFGEMVACENSACAIEWFHYECVGLTDTPGRTTKWYCPECRIALGIGEKGAVTARGRKK